MKKIIKYILEHWYYILLLISITSFFVNNTTPNNDIWFILNNGKYIFNKGIPYIDPFTIHNNLSLVMQQWLSSIIFYTIYKLFTIKGLLILTLISYLLFLFIYYKLINLYINNKKYSFIILSILSFFISSSFISRPQIFTFIILILETYLIELYIKKDNYKYLIPLPFLSLLEINLHSSMWLLQFVFILPFIINSISIKKITIDKIKIKPILIVALLMFLAGFINPYGYKAITYLFNSYGLKEINNYIYEMKVSSINDASTIIILLLNITLIFILNYFKKVKLDIRHILFIIGTLILALMHRKCFPLFVIWYGYSIAYLLKNIKINKISLSKELSKLIKEIIILLYLMISILFISTSYITITNYNFDDRGFKEVLDYIEKTYDKNRIIIYNDFEYGGYIEYRGIKAFIDSRIELFYKKNNHQKDIFINEYKMHMFDKNFNYDKFIKEYNFTHIIAADNNGIYYYLENNNTNYYLAKEYFYKDINRSIKIYIRKDIILKK